MFPWVVAKNEVSATRRPPRHRREWRQPPRIEAMEVMDSVKLRDLLVDALRQWCYLELTEACQPQMVRVELKRRHRPQLPRAA